MTLLCFHSALQDPAALAELHLSQCMAQRASHSSSSSHTHAGEARTDTRGLPTAASEQAVRSPNLLRLLELLVTLSRSAKKRCSECAAAAAAAACAAPLAARSRTDAVLLLLLLVPQMREACFCCSCCWCCLCSCWFELAMAWRDVLLAEMLEVDAASSSPAGTELPFCEL
jgi:hypothetical protein